MKQNVPLLPGHVTPANPAENAYARSGARAGGATLRCLGLALALAGGLLVSEQAVAQTFTFSKQVTSGNDDAEEDVASGSMDLSSSDLELTEDGGAPQVIGMRFTGISLPANAYITNAYVQFSVDEVHNPATNVTIKGHADDNSGTFGTASFGISLRPTTTAAVNWAIPFWPTEDVAGPNQATPDIKAIINEVISRPGWVNGNALTLIVTGSGRRNVHAYNGSAAMAPRLVIEYKLPTVFSAQVVASADDAEERGANATSNAGGMDLTSSDLELVKDGSTGDQFVGMRFRNIPVPNGATITNAYIQFTQDEYGTSPEDTNPAQLLIKGENTDNATAFAAAAFNISSRPTTTAGTPWTIVPNWTTLAEAGPNQRTPNLAAVIAEITSRPGWAPGNALNLIVTGTGRRFAESFDGSAPDTPRLVIEYILDLPPVGSLSMAQNATWAYNDLGQDLGTAWITPNYNDSLWAFGPGVLGYSNPNTTTLSFGPDPSNKHITYYFRHKFEAANVHQIDSLVFNVLRDDGAIVYLNGVEQFRMNMPAGPVNYLTHSATIVDGANETTYFQQKVKATDLVNGLNVLAVEVHQRDGQSSDLSFGMSIDTIMRQNQELIAFGDTWKYLDNGADQGSAWVTGGFNDAAWAAGPAILGYGNGDEATTISAGPDAANKHITTYFRKQFTVTDTATFGSLKLMLKKDDGAIVYLNGTEVLRSNILNGAVTYQTTAVLPVEGAEEDAILEAIINKSLLVIGTNTLAVEVHKYNATETDKRFDLSLALLVDQFPLTPNANIVDCDPNSSDAIGCFTSVKPGPQQQEMVFPFETHAFQLLAKAGTTPYTDGTPGTLAGSNDFTGYIARNGSSKHGYLSINHETSPGGVSLLNLQFNENSKTWNIDSVRKVDFAPVVQTQTNCSGGITPWGTVITSEENFSTGDADGDGYQDRGWQVEINPATGQVLDHNGDGQPDKLWALGRMSHENIAVGVDSVTVYQAEDGGSSAVYKFVANTAGNLSEGTLYALKRDSATATTGTWVLVPNTTQADRNNTRTLASSLGATNWSGAEDIEFGPDGKMYFTSKGTGTIWRFKDDGATVSEIEAWVTNTQYAIAYAGGTQNENFGTGIDNLTFDGEGNLWALQDGGRAHLWIIRPNHTPANPHVDLFLTAPAGSESTGLTFSPDFRYGFISFQHPSGSNSAVQVDAAGNPVTFNSHSTIVFARKQYLGAGAVTPEFALGADTAICDGESLVLNAANGSDVITVWNDGTTGAQKTVTAAGTYVATAYANNGQTYTDSITVTLNALPVADLGADQNLCATETVLDAGNAGNSNTFLWSDGSVGQTLTATATGTYSVTVTNPATGCATTDEVVVTLNADPVVNLGPDMTICATCNMVLNAGFGFNAYLWNTGETTPTITADSTGNYWVTVTNAAGCTATDTVMVSIVSGTLDVATLEKMVEVYPNPFAKVATLKLTLAEPAEIALTVLDLTGKAVTALSPQQLPQGVHELRLNLAENGAAQGVYMLRLTVNGTQLTRRLVAQ